jgi:hypothetical protein
MWEQQGPEGNVTLEPQHHQSRSQFRRPLSSIQHNPSTLHCNKHDENLTVIPVANGTHSGGNSMPTAIGSDVADATPKLVVGNSNNAFFSLSSSGGSCIHHRVHNNHWHDQ